jgi:hypothetical protein
LGVVSVLDRVRARTPGLNCQMSVFDPIAFFLVSGDASA